MEAELIRFSVRQNEPLKFSQAYKSKNKKRKKKYHWVKIPDFCTFF